MHCYEVTFYYKDEPTLDSPILIDAENIDDAKAILYEKVQTGSGIPGNWDKYDQPVQTE